MAQEPNINNVCISAAEALYSAASQSKNHNVTRERYDGEFITPDVRWQSIINERDHRKLWQSINWKGQFDKVQDSSKSPSDECFCLYYENLLKQEMIHDFIPALPK